MMPMLILASFVLVVVPDGNWWGDGTQWLPSERTTIRTVNRPG